MEIFMKKALIYFEKGYETVSLDLLEVVRQMQKEDVYQTYALCVNHGGNEAIGQFDYRIIVEDNKIEWHDVLNITNVMEELHQRENFDCIIIPATWVGRMLAPRLAMRLKTGLVADVTAINSEADEVELIRPAFDGKILAGIVNNNSSPIMMSVRPGVFSYQQQSEKETKDISYELKQAVKSGVWQVALEKKKKTNDIRDSKVLVSGGGGIQEDFEILHPLAGKLHGMVAASRRIVDSNLAPRSIQVGQTGKTVSPSLYIAIGIHGSMQHFEGLKRVKHIIAVNTNPLAPLCSQADIVVKGGGVEFVNQLMKRIEKD
jgi:electron transfer flavoprotein alpha subunit